MILLQQVNKNKSPVDREPIIKQDVLSIDAGVYNNSSPAKKGTNFNENTLSTEPGVNNKRAAVEREPDKTKRCQSQMQALITKIACGERT